jgi:hypothetical protein
VIPWVRHSSERSVDVLMHRAANLPCTSSSIAEAALASGTSLDIVNYGKSRSALETPDIAKRAAQGGHLFAVAAAVAAAVASIARFGFTGISHETTHEKVRIC